MIQQKVDQKQLVITVLATSVIFQPYGDYRTNWWRKILDSFNKLAYKTPIHEWCLKILTLLVVSGHKPTWVLLDFWSEVNDFKQLIHLSPYKLVRIISLFPLSKLYVINFVSDLWQFNGFLQVLQFLPPIKLTTTI